MSAFRLASEKASGRAGGSILRATGAVAACQRGDTSQAKRRRVEGCSPAGQGLAAFTGKGCSSLPFSAIRSRGRASLDVSRAIAANGPSTANKSLKYVPALRASTGRG